MIIKLMGGLGNQMFQYALYKKLLTMGVAVSIDDREIVRYGNQHNGVELERAFGLHYKKMSTKDIVKHIMWNLDNRIFKRINMSKEDTYLLEDDFKVSLDEIIYGNHEYLYGYWQNADYFENIEDQIRNDFIFRGISFDKRNVEVRRLIETCESTGVHIRRGDYLEENDRKGICTINYYNAAIAYIRNIFPKTHFFFFSDDIEWVRENFHELNPIIVDNNIGKDSYLDMYLMSLCHHQIIANSTFSWWAAWLNTYKRKIIICPKVWIKNSILNPTLKNWKRITEDGEIALY